MLRANTWIVVPLYNEAPVVRETIEKLLPIGGRIVIVDDGSTDGGAEMLDGLRFAAEKATVPFFSEAPISGDGPNVTLLRHPFNLGQGAALSTGFQYALAQGAQFIATFDSDGQYLAEDLVAMQDYLVGDAAIADHERRSAPSRTRRASTSGSESPALSPEFDIVTGSRFLGQTVGMPYLRGLLVSSSRWLARALYGVRLTDTQNGVRMMNRRAAEKMLFVQNRMAHAMEAHARIARYRLRHAEFPNTMIYTDYSRSKGQRNLLGSLRILYDLFIPTLFRKRTLALERHVTLLAQRMAIVEARDLGDCKAPLSDDATRRVTADKSSGHAATTVRSSAALVPARPR